MTAKKQKRRRPVAVPPPELIPFLDAIAEMLADAIERDAAAKSTVWERKAGTKR